MSFKMDTFYAFTLLQETHVNMPFQHWELRPRGQDSVTLTITAALCEVRITVQASSTQSAGMGFMATAGRSPYSHTMTWN